MLPRLFFSLESKNKNLLSYFLSQKNPIISVLHNNMSDNKGSPEIHLNFDNRSLRELPIDSEEHNFTRQVSGACFSRVDPTPVERPKVVAFSKTALELIGLNENDVKSKTFVDALSGCDKFEGSETYAHCYCGHQFGHFAGQLGDGAAIYLGKQNTFDKS